MLRKYNGKGQLFLHGSAGKYAFKDGTIIERETGQALRSFTSDGERYMEVVFLGKSMVLKEAVLICLGTKNPRLYHEQIPKVDVHYVDGNPSNLHPKNLIWKFPEQGLCVGNSAFRVIPGYTRYAIDAQGNLYSKITDKFVSPYLDNSGYVMFGLNPDIGPRGICGQHRLLALAFLPYPRNVDKLDVNHLDAIKCNNGLDNLEWASRKGNCDHAYLSGLRDDNIPVLVRNAFTGDVRRFYSIERAAEWLKMDGEGVRARLRFRGQKIYPPGVLLKKENDSLPWAEFQDPQEAIIRCKAPLAVAVRDISSGDEFELGSISAASRLLGVESRKLHYLLSKKKPIIIDKYRVSFPLFEHKAKSLFTEM